jgi:hypothetical protein
LNNITHVETITEVHAFFGLDKPNHPLVTVLPIDERMAGIDYGDATYVFGFYQISLKSDICGEIRYGRNL